MTGRPQDRPTLDSVAASLGISKATVSKVLNDRPGVSTALRARVRAALEEVGYERTTIPGASSGRRSVVVVLETLANLYYLRILDGLVAEAAAGDVELVLEVINPLASSYGREITEERIRELHRRGHAGMLVVTARLPSRAVAVCADLRFPVVAIDPTNALPASVPSVGSNAWSGGMQATEHLIELGHRRIGFVGGIASHAGFRERRSGYRAALEAAGIPEDPALVAETGIEGSGEAALTMLELPAPPTAFFCVTDPGALLVVRELTHHGLSVPGDVSVVGYDDTYAAVPGPIELTTVNTPLPEIARLGMSTLLGIGDGIEPVSHHVQLATTLVTRETTAPPASASGLR
ncbi:LacI family DNA-binding transcriptional regulator [Brachybacterium massiliense]|uniref:LacI family DNA-binding transcriptional regulator n=1 Tax=Brachybacterium massiliense TaxID=1755098 RepID=UPI000B3BC136|nr:LacI family DNA-binding transcriptional regulator [Brachybacterium massiliense]